MSFQDFNVVSLINSGSFGPCYKVCHKKSQKYYVWKAIDFGMLPSHKQQRILRSISILTELHHINLIQYHQSVVHQPSQTLYVMMDFCNSENLSTLLKKCHQARSYLDEGFIWKVIYQVAKGLQVCHQNVEKILIHGNIRPQNVFVDQRGQVKISNFGLVKECQSNSFRNSCYYSPEVIKTGVFGTKNDIWSLGCLTFEMCSLTPPFNNTSWSAFTKNPRQMNIPLIPNQYSEDLTDIIRLMLTVREDLRPNISAILFHPSIIARLMSSKQFEQDYDLEKNTLSESSFKSDASLCMKCKTLQQKLENLKDKNKILKAREVMLNEKEFVLNKREKQVALMETLVKEKLKKADGILKQQRLDSNLDTSFDDIDSVYSLNVSEVENRTRAVRLSPSKVVQPAFLRNTTNRKTVHFESPRSLQTIFEYSIEDKNLVLGNINNEKVHSFLENKKIKSNFKKSNGKENVKSQPSTSGSNSSLASLQAITVESNGNFETHFR